MDARFVETTRERYENIMFFYSGMEVVFDKANMIVTSVCLKDVAQTGKIMLSGFSRKRFC